MAQRMDTDPARNDQLILVDGCDRQVGSATKEYVHEHGLLHRAFSVVLVRNNAGSVELLLAQRAEGKYHSAGLWANSCCSHPRVGEQTIDAAYRRVQEELGCKAAGLREIAAFVYRAQFDNGLAEYEYDHVFIGNCQGEPCPDSSEVGGLRWITVADLASELADSPEKFAAWAYTVLSLAM